MKAILLLASFCIVQSVHTYGLLAAQKGSPIRAAILPFEQKGLTDEEAQALVTSLADHLRASGTFDVMAHEEMLRVLKEAEFNLENCTYSYCLADAGKVLGVQRIVHGSITRRGKLYTLRLRMVDVRTAEILFDRRSEHSGEFDQLLTEVLPQEASAAGQASLTTGTKWYVVAAAVVVTVGAIYSIYRAFNKTAASEGTGPEPPTTE